LETRYLPYSKITAVYAVPALNPLILMIKDRLAGLLSIDLAPEDFF
jgi:hypothetical protein